jgi:hypothetical protein
MEGRVSVVDQVSAVDRDSAPHKGLVAEQGSPASKVTFNKNIKGPYKETL